MKRILWAIKAFAPIIGFVVATLFFVAAVSYTVKGCAEQIEEHGLKSILEEIWEGKQHHD